jgi:hypothetical protein
MNKQTAFTAAMLAVLAFGLGYPTRVLADDGEDNGWVKSEVTFALDTNIVNGCYNDENVHILGVGEVSLKSRLKSDGTIDVKELDALSGGGTGDMSGAQYKFMERAHIDTSLGPNPDGTPFSYLEKRRQRLIGLGGVPDQFITYYINLVIDGAGNITVDVFDFNVECN